MIIAIDGPAGSGKSTISKLISRRLGILYIDTGAMYRAITLKAMNKGVDLNDKESITVISKDTSIELITDKASNLTVMLDGKDVSKEIRSPDLTNNVKFIASIPEVRREMVDMQRAIAKKGKGAVLEGRDIGTVVFPDADIKIYLDADSRQRALRRFKELKASSRNFDLDKIEKDVKLRDKSDMERSVGPLKKADDAIRIDTTYLSIEQVVDKILSLI